MSLPDIHGPGAEQRATHRRADSRVPDERVKIPEGRARAKGCVYAEAAGDDVIPGKR